MKSMPLPYMPTLQELRKAHSLYSKSEAYNISYRDATELIKPAWRNESSLSMAKAVAVLLKTWNRAYYRFHNKFDVQHFAAIEDLIKTHMGQLKAYKARSIESLSDEDDDDIEILFQTFEVILGPVGTAKALHLLAPRFFPLWDRSIAAGYGVYLRLRGENGVRYLTFMLYVQTQSALLGGEDAIGRNPLKAIDEYNYCRITKGWM